MAKRLKTNTVNPGDVFDLKLSKSQATQLKVIEVALRMYARLGIERTTYTELSKACGVSRPLINHYFPDLDSLFLAVGRYSRATLLRLAIQDVREHHDAASSLKAYIGGCFNWVTDYPDQCAFWMLYFYQSSRKGDARKENSELVDMGHRRIQSFLEAGIREKQFKISLNDVEATAKAIQILITGGIVSAITEDGFLTDKKAKQIVIDSCFSILGFKG